MIVWTINRTGDGPMKAYKNLGADLKDDVPETANNLLTSMASAIVRNCIANSTIDEIIRNRQQLREAINKEMTEVVQGWGVWLETIEITDVKILSGSLFKDMQCTFREDQNKTATLQKLEVDQEISIQKQNHDLTTKKRNEDARKVKRLEESSRNIKTKQQEVEAYKKTIAIQQKEYERKLKNWLETRKNEQKKRLEAIIDENERYKKNILNDVN